MKADITSGLQKLEIILGNKVLLISKLAKHFVTRYGGFVLTEKEYLICRKEVLEYLGNLVKLTESYAPASKLYCPWLHFRSGKCKNTLISFLLVSNVTNCFILSRLDAPKNDHHMVTQILNSKIFTNLALPMMFFWWEK